MTDGTVAKFSESPLAIFAKQHGLLWCPAAHWWVVTARGSFYVGGLC